MPSVLHCCTWIPQHVAGVHMSGSFVAHTRLFCFRSRIQISATGGSVRSFVRYMAAYSQFRGFVGSETLRNFELYSRVSIAIRFRKYSPYRSLGLGTGPQLLQGAGPFSRGDAADNKDDRGGTGGFGTELVLWSYLDPKKKIFWMPK